jgi:hypothetical protein
MSNDEEHLERIAQAVQAVVAAVSVVLFFVLVIGAVLWGARQ